MMPSASTAKLEKQASTEAVDPIKQVLVIVEHKIRNLEKRKRKIESYRELQKNGKELNADQLNAVSKYEEVLQTLEFARDLCKQFNNVAVDAAKQQKKQARKEAVERAQQDCQKIRSVLCIQDVLQNIGTESAREDFLAGRNGAAQLTEDDLKNLDDIYHEVFPRRGNEEGLPPFEDQLTSAAEHFQGIVEGKSKEVVGTTYKHIKETIDAIHNCGYFDQTLEENTEEVTPEVIDHLPGTLEAADQTALPPAVEELAEEEENFIVESQTVLPSEPQLFSQGAVAVAPVVPAPPPVQQPAQAVPPAAQPVPQAPAPAVAVAVVSSAPAGPPSVAPAPAPAPVAESSFFSTSAPAFVPNQAALPQNRALNEVISSVTGSFNFLQDSELDSPDISVMLAGSAGPPGPPGQAAPQHVVATPPPTTPVAVAPIPTQTFTNQSFASSSSSSVQQKVVFQPPGEMAHHIPGFATATPNPPPPIPMPPSHQVPGAAQPRSVPVHQMAPATAPAVPTSQPSPQAAGGVLHRPTVAAAAYGAPAPAASAHSYAAQVQPPNPQLSQHHPHHHLQHHGQPAAQPPQPPLQQLNQQPPPQVAQSTPLASAQPAVQPAPSQVQQVQQVAPAQQGPGQAQQGQVSGSPPQGQGQGPPPQGSQPAPAAQPAQPTSYAQKVDMTQSTESAMAGPAAADEALDEWQESGQGDWSQQGEAHTNEWGQPGNDDWGSSGQNDGYTTQGSNRNYARTRANSRGRGGSSNGYGGRARGINQNGRGSSNGGAGGGGGGTGSGGYGYRNEGANNYYQNGYQRENFSGYKRGRVARGAAQNAPRGMDRGGMRGMTRPTHRGVRPNFSRAANKQ